MYRIGDIYKANAAASTLMLSNFSIAGAEDDFWSDYRTNHANYDRVFNRMFNSFKPFMQLEDDTLEEVVEQFRQDVYDHLLINQKVFYILLPDLHFHFVFLNLIIFFLLLDVFLYCFLNN